MDERGVIFSLTLHPPGYFYTFVIGHGMNGELSSAFSLISGPGGSGLSIRGYNHGQNSLRQIQNLRFDN